MSRYEVSDVQESFAANACPRVPFPSLAAVLMACEVDLSDVSAVPALATTEARAVAAPIPDALCSPFTPCSREPIEDFN